VGCKDSQKKNLSPQEHLPSSFLLPSSDQKPLSPDFFHNLQKRVRSVRHNRYWFCFSSTSFLIFHKKPAPKKIENQKKNPIPTSILTKPKKATRPDTSPWNNALHRSSNPDLLPDSRKKSTEALLQSSFFVYRRSSPRTVILPAQSHNLLI
jgi:hypothetical protein